MTLWIDSMKIQDAEIVGRKPKSRKIKQTKRSYLYHFVSRSAIFIILNG